MSPRSQTVGLLAIPQFCCRLWYLHYEERICFAVSSATPRGTAIELSSLQCPLLALHLSPMPERLLASVDETGQRSQIVRAGAAVAGAVACFDTAPAPFATLVGVCGRRAMQNASTASVTAVLISA